MKRKTIYLNGRFLTQSMTGVQRTAYEIVKALDQLIENKIIENNYVLIYSGVIRTNITLKNIKVLKRGFFTGNIWEQIELPFYSFTGFLVSMCTVSTLFKRNQVVFVHDASPVVNPQFFSFLFRNWYRVATTILGRVSRKIITVSEFSKSELVSKLGLEREKIEVIYNAGDHILHYDDPDEKFKQEVDKLKPYCLAVSSLSANKNFKGLSEGIKNSLADYQMVIAGGISKTLQNWTPDNNTQYLGYVTNPQLKYLYRNAAIFIFPSFYEGFGIPPLEAMAMGCPVISSNTSSLPEVLGEACLYFDPHFPVQLSQTLKKVIGSNKKLLCLKEKGLQQASKYNWTSSALQLHRLIESI